MTGEEQGRWRLLNPLSIRFSQPRIAPHYRDGRQLDETVAEVYEAPLEFGGGACGGIAHAATGPPPFDVVLVPPFPSIRVISWLPKIRRPDGEAERNSNGDQILGERAWFALDNRRLHSMQWAAAKRWPRRCCVAVRCIEEVPGTTIRELRKFRTTTEGRSVEIGVRVGETQLWSWLKAAPPGAQIDSLEHEGFFAEDLWDAERWAPHAIAVASQAEAEDALIEKPERGSRRLQYAQRTKAVACPESGWQYVDPSGKIQGPFGLEKMRLWNKHAFFYANLQMRCSPEDAFKPFAEIFPEGVEPFEDGVLRFKQ